MAIQHVSPTHQGPTRQGQCRCRAGGDLQRLPLRSAGVPAAAGAGRAERRGDWESPGRFTSLWWLLWCLLRWLNDGSNGGLMGFDEGLMIVEWDHWDYGLFWAIPSGKRLHDYGKIHNF